MSAITDRLQAVFNNIQGAAVPVPLGLTVMNGFASNDQFLHLHPQVDDGEGNMIPKPFADMTTDEKAALNLAALKAFCLRYRNIKARDDEIVDQAAAQQAIDDAIAAELISELE